jgi:amino acid permease
MNLVFSGIPFAMKQAGFGLGIILLILVAMVTGK